MFKKILAALAAFSLLATASQAASVMLDAGNSAFISDSSSTNTTSSQQLNPATLLPWFDAVTVSAAASFGTVSAGTGVNKLFLTAGLTDQGSGFYAFRVAIPFYLTSFSASLTSDVGGATTGIYEENTSGALTTIADSIGGQPAGAFNFDVSGMMWEFLTGELLGIRLTDSRSGDVMMSSITLGIIPITSVPEPGASLLVGLALGLLVLTRSKRRHN